jgi:hypothetical protein
LKRSAAPLDLWDVEEDEGRDLFRRENIRLTSELLGLWAGGRGGIGQAPPSIPQAAAGAPLAAFLALQVLDLLRLICPMHDTLGDEASGVRYPLPPPCLLPPRLLPPPRASGGTMETMGPEPPAGREPKVVAVEEEKEAAVDLRKDARAPLLLLACFLGFLSIDVRTQRTCLETWTR